MSEYRVQMPKRSKLFDVDPRRADRLEAAIRETLAILRSGAEHHRIVSLVRENEVVAYGSRVANHADFAVACLERALGLEGK